MTDVEKVLATLRDVHRDGVPRQIREYGSSGNNKLGLYVNGQLGVRTRTRCKYLHARYQARFWEPTSFATLRNSQPRF